MVEDTAVRTHIIEYRLRSRDGGPGDLIACALVDLMSDGLSLVYSFYDPTQARRSLGSFVILDHLIQAGLTDMPYVYLGYWVRGSDKMDYKVRFSPIELLRPEGWRLMSARDGRPTRSDPAAAPGPGPERNEHRPGDCPDDQRPHAGEFDAAVGLATAARATSRIPPRS